MVFAFLGVETQALFEIQASELDVSNSFIPGESDSEKLYVLGAYLVSSLNL